ncbi:hypothetical protein BCR33DRAFT_765190 [Rhizoclosmatium globosum]|uniref:Uncharacterized protein n=1 Tax=Rhizoclosmatium globosum TaxID=329046 RepID=A0A1Y2CGD2_9FUNG|nr:hypothetical protein BCR33DRAFT_765190 [Rhizoclosmatium globosum]|eukprot:ORY45967.1 hypothetical protein BCR33DRAFT_765190 [Rhizoclosmatium globosum]
MIYTPAHPAPLDLHFNKLVPATSTLPSPLPSPTFLDQERPTLLVDIVLKVMTRLYYGVKTVKLSETADHEGFLISITPAASIDSTRHYQELFDLKDLMVTLIQRAPSRNSKALTVTVIQALLLAHRMLAHHQSNTELYPLPACLSSPKNLFLAALTLSEACLMDCQTSTRIWGKLSEYPPSHVAHLKTSALVYMQYSVHVGSQEFAWWCQVVMQWMRLVGSQF